MPQRPAHTQTALQERISGTDGDEWTPERRRRVAAEILAPIRDYPDQMAICQAIVANENNQAVYGTRRSGKTDVIMRILLALMVMRDRFVVRMLTNVLVSPTRNVFARISDGGTLALMRRLGLMSVCRLVRGGPDRAIVGIVFDWGSTLTVHHIAHAAAIDNIHGFEGGHVVWIDEATKTPMMEFALRNLVNPTLADQTAIKLLSYTPDEEVDGLAAQLATEPALHWDRHHMRQWRNPHFGPTFAARWLRIVERVVELSHLEYGLGDEDIAQLHALTEAECDAISLSQEPERLKAWVKTLDPELLRNIFGRWVRHGAKYVYPWHKLPVSELYWCALGPLSSHGGLIPVAPTMADRVAMLPAHPDGVAPRDWQVSMAFDLGTVDAWAGVALAWSPTYPRALELETRKETGLDDDQMFEAMCDQIADLEELRGVRLTSNKGDLSGMRKATQMSWDRKLKQRFPRLRDLGITAARKREKHPRIKQHWLDMMQRRLQVISGGHLDVEGMHLRYLPQKPGKPLEVDKHREIRQPGGQTIEPGDHACDGMLYAFDPIPILDCKVPDFRQSQLPNYFNIGHQEQQQW